MELCRNEVSLVSKCNVVKIDFYMQAIAGQTAGQNWLTFFEGTYEDKILKDKILEDKIKIRFFSEIFFSKLEILFFKIQNSFTGHFIYFIMVKNLDWAHSDCRALDLLYNKIEYGLSTF